MLAKDEVGGVLAAGLDKISLKDSLDQVRRRRRVVGREPRL